MIVTTKHPDFDQESPKPGFESRVSLTRQRWEEKMMILRLKSCNTMLLLSLLILCYLTQIVQSYHLVRSTAIIRGRHIVGTVNNLLSRHSTLLHHSNLYMAASGGRGGGSTKLDRKTCESTSLQLFTCCTLLCPMILKSIMNITIQSTCCHH